jgi:hypothetical protein
MPAPPVHASQIHASRIDDAVATGMAAVPCIASGFALGIAPGVVQAFRPGASAVGRQGGFLPPAAIPHRSAVVQASPDSDDEEEEDDDEEDEEEDDPSYYERKSASSNANKIPRPSFKPDAYDRLAIQHGVVRCDGTEATIKGRAPYYKYKEGNAWVYLTKDYKEMRSDKSTKEWRRVDKDHSVDHIALVAAAKETTTLSKEQLDFAFQLAFRSTKHLNFLSRNRHKKKKTFRLNSVPLGIKKKAKTLLARKAGKWNAAKHARLRRSIERDHQGSGPSWSYTRYF